MEIIYLRSFLKDLQSLPDISKKSMKKIIAVCKSAEKLDNIPSLKRLKGHPFAYRIRMGDYRIGLYIKNNHIQFVRVAHRKDIYKSFP
jgi:mRNA interferase RelE/StbE